MLNHGFRLESSSSPVAKLFHEYLRDKGIVMNNINIASLYRFFHRFVNPYNGSGKVTSDDQLTNGPEHFGNLLNNMRLIAQEISPSINTITGVNRSATVDFSVLPCYSAKKTIKALADVEKDSDEILFDRRLRVGGYFYVFAYSRLGNNPWIQIQYGFRFEIRSNTAHSLNVGMYAQINGSEIYENCYIDKSKAQYKKELARRDSKSYFISELKLLMNDVLLQVIDQNLVKAARKKTLLALIKQLS